MKCLVDFGNGREIGVTMDRIPRRDEHVRYLGNTYRVVSVVHDITDSCAIDYETYNQQLGNGFAIPFKIYQEVKSIIIEVAKL